MDKNFEIMEKTLLELSARERDFNEFRGPTNWKDEVDEPWQGTRTR